MHKILYIKILFSYLFFIIKIIYNISRKWNNKNQTPLHFAAKSNSKEIGELLISKGADVNAISIIYQITS